MCATACVLGFLLLYCTRCPRAAGARGGEGYPTVICVMAGGGVSTRHGTRARTELARNTQRKQLQDTTVSESKIMSVSNVWHYSFTSSNFKPSESKDVQLLSDPAHAGV